MLLLNKNIGCAMTALAVGMLVEDTIVSGVENTMKWKFSPTQRLGAHSIVGLGIYATTSVAFDLVDMHSAPVARAISDGAYWVSSGVAGWFDPKAKKAKVAAQPKVEAVIEPPAPTQLEIDVAAQLRLDALVDAEVEKLIAAKAAKLNATHVTPKVRKTPRAA